MKRVYKLTFISMVISSLALFGQWQKYIIDNSLGKPEIVAIGDLNNDNKVDVVVNDLKDNKIILYENNYPDWNKHILDSKLEGAYVPDIGDLDGDGDLDVAASGYRENVIVWYENNYPVWNKHIIAENLKVSGAVSIADIDGDDILDVVSSGYRQGGDLVWYENNHPIWTKHMIRSDYATEWSWVGDIDGDGAIDIAVCRWYENEVNWLKNENAGQSWSEFRIDDELNHASHLSFGDIDRDSDMDITVAGESDDVVVWYENNHPEWEKHIIDANFHKAWTVVVADIDSDEKPDVAAVSNDADLVVWYKNNHPEWEKQNIDPNLDGPLVLLSADIDNDNATDMVVPGCDAGNLVWYKNPYTNVAFAELVEVFPKYLGHTDDTLKFTAEISNPENHLASAYTILNGIQSTHQDSIELFDDGLHGDGEPSDNIYANNILMPTLEEDFFEMKFATIDSNESKTTFSAAKAYFTTAGPVVWKDYVITQFNDSVYAMKVTLENLSSSFTVTEISALLSTTDSNVTEIFSGGYNPQYYPDIGPGQSVQNSGFFNYRFYTKNNPENVEFALDIYSHKRSYWKDTSMVVVTDIEENGNNLPKEYSLEQNYPNPFNPNTTIKYQIPAQGRNDNLYVSLKVYDILGREVAILVNQKQIPGHYEVEFDASTSSAAGNELTSGIYFYQLRAGASKGSVTNYIETKIMLMIK